MRSFIFIFSFLLLICFVITEPKLITGANLMNRGLDYWKGGLVPNEVLKGPIFTLTIDPSKKWSPPGRSDLVFLIPKEMTLTPNATHHELTSSDLYYSYEEAIKVDISSFGFSIGLDLGKFGFGAEYSKESGKIKEYLKEKFKATSRTYYTTSTYSLIEIPYPFMKLDDTFKMTLDYLPSTAREEDLPKFKVFMDYYGGFFAYRANFGGLIKLFTFCDNELASSKNTSWVKEQLKFTFHYRMWALSAGGFYNRSELEKKIAQQFKDHSITEMFIHGGLREYQKNDTLKEWDKSIDDEAGLLHANFRPLSDIIQEDPVKQKNLEWMIKKYSETGKLMVPPTAMHIQGLPKIPGYTVVGSGFDPVYMQPRLSIFDHEDGFANPTLWKNPFYPEHQFLIPETIHLTDNPGSIEKNLTEISLSKNEYETTFSYKQTKKFMFGFGKRTTTIFHYYYRFEIMHEYLLEMERMLTWYDLKLKPTLLFNPEKYMSTTFKSIIDGLGENCNDVATRTMYRLLIEYFGTHLITGVSMGGSAQQKVYFKQELLQIHQISEVITQTKFSFAGLLKSRDYNYKLDKNLAEWFKDNSIIEMKFKGGRYNPKDKLGKEEPWEEFVKTLRTDPAVMQYDIIPISLLFKNPAKQACMDRIIKDYLTEMAETTKYPY